MDYSKYQMPDGRVIDAHPYADLFTRESMRSALGRMQGEDPLDTASVNLGDIVIQMGDLKKDADALRPGANGDYNLYLADQLAAHIGVCMDHGKPAKNRQKDAYTGIMGYLKYLQEALGADQDSISELKQVLDGVIRRSMEDWQANIVFQGAREAWGEWYERA